MTDEQIDTLWRGLIELPFEQGAPVASFLLKGFPGECQHRQLVCKGFLAFLKKHKDKLILSLHGSKEDQLIKQGYDEMQRLAALLVTPDKKEDV